MVTPSGYSFTLRFREFREVEAVSRQGIVKLSEVGAAANHISLIRHTRPGGSRERIASNPGLIA
jgi:hypothetical protein